MDGRETLEHLKAGSRRQKRKKRRKQRGRDCWFLRHPVVVMAAVIMMMGVAASGIAVYGIPFNIQGQLDIPPDQNAMTGKLHDRDSMKVKEGDYWVLVNQLPTIQNGSHDCNIEFENPKENAYASRISLYSRDTGNYLGGTNRVDPGKYVKYVELNQTPEPGEYPVLAKIELFTRTEPAGELTLELTLRVLE